VPLLKPALAWLVILALAIANGILREEVLLPALGKPGGLIVSGLLLCVLVALVAHGLVRLGPGFTVVEGARIGILWLGLALAFEFAFGRYVQHKSWGELLDAYKLTDGNIWPVVLAVTLLAPPAAALIDARTKRAKAKEPDED
jgi:hypothetical protein